MWHTLMTQHSNTQTDKAVTRHSQYTPVDRPHCPNSALEASYDSASLQELLPLHFAVQLQLQHQLHQQLHELVWLVAQLQ